MDRKKFISKLALGTLASAAILKSCHQDTAPDTDKVEKHRRTFEWRMVTTWPPNFPIVGEACNLFARWLGELSDGRLRIKVFGSGELIPGLECFDAVSSGTVEVGSGAAYYWAGKAPAAQFFGTVPFGMNAQQVNAWLEGGGGMDLWRELYHPFDLEPFAGGNTGTQMGGWFNKKIDSVDDLKGLKMRIPGLGGKVLEELGGAAVLSAGSEIYTNLERGVIDATEWIGPYHDYLMGFHQIAKYYYYPGWHEPGTILEIFVNRSKLNELPKDLQAMVAIAARAVNQWVLANSEARNPEYLKRIRDDQRVEILQFPDEVIQAFRQATHDVIDSLCEKDPMVKKVWDSYSGFKKLVSGWAEISEKSYYDRLSY